FPPILVLGATGRIGRILRLCWSGEPVRWQCRRPERGADWVRFDPLRDPAELARAADGCAVILNLAGVVPGRETGGTGALEDTTGLALAAIRAAAAGGARVLLSSSAAVYGNLAGVVSEDMAAPVSEYGRAKRDMELRAAELADRMGVPVTALRIGNVAGLDAALGGWQPGFRLDRFPDGRTPLRSYIGPKTLARVLGDLCAAPGLPDVLNVAAPEPVEMGALLRAAGLDWNPRPASETAIPQVHLSTTRLSRFTRFSQHDSLPAQMVAEWRALEPDMDKS
ncbi:MAG: NAD(P)-dependent oxidoreductase, partial [Pseudomonadota bacterium]